MKSLVVFLVSAALAVAQAPTKIVTFDRADTEHCKVITVSGRPLLQSTYEGTSVSVSMPMNRGNGDFSVFVAVSQTGSGTFKVDPKDFFGLYSDKDHTRFTFYDKAAEIDAASHPGGDNAGLSAAKSQLDPGSLRPGAVGPGGPPLGAGPQDGGGPPAAAGPKLG